MSESAFINVSHKFCCIKLKICELLSKRCFSYPLGLSWEELLSFSSQLSWISKVLLHVSWFCLLLHNNISQHTNMSTRYLKIAHTLSWLLVLPGWFRDSNNITNNLKVYVFAFLLSRPCKLCSIDTNILLMPICLI